MNKFNNENNINDFLNTSLIIGKKTVEKRLFLAPMSKLGTPAFRELIAFFGGFGLLFTEMCSAKTVPFGNGHHISGFIWGNENLSKVVCQIFGNDPDVMAIAARRIEEEGFFGVDINFGCSLSTLCKKNLGAALLKDPDLAIKIVSSVRKSVSIPVFVKFRTGWKDDPEIAVDFAKRFQDSGADALVFHPRVAPDRRTRPPKWNYIKMVKQSVDIPVIGNGNVFDISDCEKMIETTGCDGVALGRIAIARPWIFAQWSDHYIPEKDVCRKSAIELARRLEFYFGPEIAVRRFKSFSPYFSANFLFGHSLFSNISKASSINDIEEELNRFFNSPRKLLSKPNISIFG